MTERNQKIADSLQVELIEGLPLMPRLSSLIDLHQRVFTGQSSDELLSEMTYQLSRRLTTVLAIDNDRVVGYKMGYERKPGQYYSWLGCVDSAYRGKGIASGLMQYQHDWSRSQGYATIRTQTYNQWRSMLLLNIRYGFDIIGTQQGTHGLLIVLEKKL